MRQLRQIWLTVLGAVLVIAGVLFWLVTAWWAALWGVDGDAALAVGLTGALPICVGILLMAVDA